MLGASWSEIGEHWFDSGIEMIPGHWLAYLQRASLSILLENGVGQLNLLVMSSNRNAPL